MPPSNTPIPQGPKLLDQLRDRIRFKHYSICMETQYVQWVAGSSQFTASASARDVGVDEVDAFRLPFAVDGKVTATAQNGAGYSLSVTRSRDV